MKQIAFVLVTFVSQEVIVRVEMPLFVESQYVMIIGNSRMHPFFAARQDTCQLDFTQSNLGRFDLNIRDFALLMLIYMLQYVSKQLQPSVSYLGLERFQGILKWMMSSVRGMKNQSMIANILRQTIARCLDTPLIMRGPVQNVRWKVIHIFYVVNVDFIWIF